MNNKNHILWVMSALAIPFLMSSCKKELDANNPSPAAKVLQDTVRHPFPLNKGGIVKQGTYRGSSITYQEIDGQAIWQGDILLGQEDLTPSETNNHDANARTSGIGLSNEHRRWKQGRIPYVIEDGLETAFIKNAMASWEDKTPIKFIPRTNEFDYIYIRRSSQGARSFVGRQGGMQIVEFPNSTSEFSDVIVHELGHAIGLVHEHMRSDRNNFITFHPENLQEGINPVNFFEISNIPGDVGFDSYGGFDFESVMLYDSHDGGKFENGQLLPVLEKKDGSTWGPTFRQSPSLGDKETVRAMYSYVYLVRGDNLYSITNQGQLSKLGPGWKGTSTTIADGGRYIWAFQNGKLWRADRLNGSYQSMGSGNWVGALGVTGRDPQGNFYAQDGDRLWKIFPNGNFTHLPGTGWLNAKSILYHNGALYVIWGKKLYKVNTNDGSYKILEQNSTDDWSQVKAMTALSLTAQEIYIMTNEDGRLWQVNTDTGKVSLLKFGFNKTTAMAGLDDRLYIITNGQLHIVDKKGNTLMDKYGQNPLIIGNMEDVTSIGPVRILGL